MFGQQLTGGEPGDQGRLPGEPGTAGGETGPAETDPVTAGGEDAGDPGDDAMSDDLGQVAGGAEISEPGPTA